MPIIITQGTQLQGSAMPKIVKEFQSMVVGRTIKLAGYYQDEEGGEVVPCLQLDNGTIILSSADDEGNGPGVMEACTPDKSAMLCETRAKS